MSPLSLQVEFVIAFIGVTLARGVAAPLNSSYLQARLPFPYPSLAVFCLHLCRMHAPRHPFAICMKCDPAMQDEFKFYMEDAASKLLLVPVAGNKHAEAAASGLSIPITSMQLRNKGQHPLFSPILSDANSEPGFQKPFHPSGCVHAIGCSHRAPLCKTSCDLLLTYCTSQR